MSTSTMSPRPLEDSENFATDTQFEPSEHIIRYGGQTPIPLKKLKSMPSYVDNQPAVATEGPKDTSVSVSQSDVGAAESSPIPENAKSNSRLIARIQFSSVCFSLFLAGWNDGAVGPLLPRIQQVYRVNIIPYRVLGAFTDVTS